MNAEWRIRNAESARVDTRRLRSFSISRSAFRMPAFTLIEVMVVVVILGVLATIVTVSVTDYLVKGKQTAARTEISAIQQALQLYYSETDKYPSTDEGVALLLKPSTSHPNGLLQGDLLDPWGHAYVYVYPGVHGAFDLCSFGANGQEGGLGADVDICTWDKKGKP